MSANGSVADAVIRGEQVTKRFGGLAAVQQVDFAVPRGSIYGLIGPNGAGKTTLFRMISGVYPPTSGHIFLDDREITGLPPYRVCQLGVVTTHQIVRPFLDLTVLDNVRVGAHFGKPGTRSESEVCDWAEEVLSFTGLAERRHDLARSLNLPQRKRLEVARALATRPKVLLLDEVIAGLNPTEQGRTMELIRRVRERGITIVMVEHLMKAIMGLCDRILVLSFGQRIAEGTPDEIANDPKVIEAYLGSSDDDGT
jgi:branched-chain amino acid transport system ATP-binding protein